MTVTEYREAVDMLEKAREQAARIEDMIADIKRRLNKHERQVGKKRD